MDYLMRAASSVDGQLYSWTDDAPDWAAAGYPGDGTATDVVVAASPATGAGGTGAPGGSVGQVQTNDGSGGFTGISFSSVGSVLRQTGATAASFGQLDLADTDGVTGILPLANGGLGFSSVGATGSVAVSTGTGITFGRLDLGDSDGVTGTLPGANMQAAASGVAGSMSGNDKDKLDGIQKQGTAISLATSTDIDWSTGSTFFKTLGAGSNTLTFSNATSGQRIIVALTGAASTVTWPTVKWAGGAAPTQTASGTDVYTFVKVGSTIYGSVDSAPGGDDGSLQQNIGGKFAAVFTDASGAPAEGDVARYDGSKWIAADDVAELPSGLTAGDLIYWTGSALGRIPAGTEGQVLTMVSGVPAWADGGGGGFDIASLALSGNWGPDYDSSPWTDEASAGTSGGLTLSSGAAPSAGSAVNGHVPASFNGSSHYLDTALSAGDFFTEGAYTIVLLVKPKSPSAPAGNVYDNEQLLSSTPYAQFGIAWSTSGVKAWHTESGPFYKETNWLACAADAFAMVAVTFDGASLGISVNNGSPETVATTSNDFAALEPLPIRLGRVFGSGTTYTEMEVLHVLTAPTALSSGGLDDIKGAFNTLYGLSL